MSDGLDQRYAIRKNLVTMYQPQRVIGDGRPFGNGVPEALRCLRLRSLDVDGNATPLKDLVLAAVVKVQVTVHHRDNVTFIDPVLRQRFGDRDNTRVVELVDEAASDANARVEEDDSIGVANRVTEDLATPVSETRMPVRTSLD